jgi:hypothetical protein
VSCVRSGARASGAASRSGAFAVSQLERLGETMALWDLACGWRELPGSRLISPAMGVRRMAGDASVKAFIKARRVGARVGHALELFSVRPHCVGLECRRGSAEPRSAGGCKSC